MNNLKLLSLILLSCPFGATADSPFIGMSGREILSKINLTMRPTSYVANQTGSDGAWMTIYDYALNEAGLLIDYFDTDHTAQASTPPPSGIYLTNIAPIDWWGNYSKYGSNPKLDLHNIVTAGSEVSGLKSDLPPGNVISATYSNGTWSVGTGKYYGVNVSMYSPPKGREGDFARTLMYCTAMYPMDLWCGKGYYIFADGTYPLLTDYGIELLMAWHRADPVDDFELKRNKAIAARQGNENPFVSYPDIAEYIWGNHTGETFDSEQTGNQTDDPDNNQGEQPEVVPNDNIEDSPSDNTEAMTAYPIKATYSISQDRYISLTSPYLPDELTWSFDGKETESTFISLDSLSEGEHFIRYYNSDLSGIIKIFITE